MTQVRVGITLQWYMKFVGIMLGVDMLSKSSSNKYCLIVKYMHFNFRITGNRIISCSNNTIKKKKKKLMKSY